MMKMRDLRGFKLLACISGDEQKGLQVDHLPPESSALVGMAKLILRTPPRQDRGIKKVKLIVDMLTDQISPFIREIRVIVWWGDTDFDEEKSDDWVEIVTHVVNPTGQVVPAAAQ